MSQIRANPTSPPLPARILIVEDDAALRRALVLALGESWGVVAEADDGIAALEWIEDPQIDPFDLVVTDLRLPGADGVEVLRAARARAPRTEVLMMSGYGSVESAVEAMRLGAFDFVQKPFELEELELRVAQALERARWRSAESRGGESSASPAQSVVAVSSAMKEAISQARRVASIRSTVLVSGETGTGKEIIAGLIHSLSPRADRPFVKVNCAALPEMLLESELFGHERGAFTGAERQRVGRFEQASGGTLLLDEVGDMSFATQAKLLRVLQDQEFHRLGGTRPLRTDARIVAATNRALDRAVEQGSFRQDLYFRLNVIGIHLVPLRERPEDTVALAERFLGRIGGELDRPARGFTQAAVERLRSHSWPGNVRELRNVIERAVLMAEGPLIGASDISVGEARPSGAAGAWRCELPPEGVSLGHVEREFVLAALRRTGFVQKEAAELLGVSRRKLNYMVGRMGLTHPSWRRHRHPA